MKVMAALLIEDVQAAEVVDGGGHHGLHLGVDGQVGRDGQALATGRLDPGHRLVDGAHRALGLVPGGPGRAGHVAARFGQGHGRGRAHAPAGPGHQGHLAVQILHEPPPPPVRAFAGPAPGA